MALSFNRQDFSSRYIKLFCIVETGKCAKLLILLQIEPRREKTGLRGFRPGPTQTGLYSLRKELEA